MLNYLNPLTYLKWIGEFIYAWGMSIPWGNIPKTIPALVLVVALAVATVISWNDSSNRWRANLLKKQLMTALDTDDFATAELLLARQVQDRPTDGDLRYRLAMIQHQQDKTEQALAQMRLLVANKRHREAARWIITQEYNRKQWAELSEEQQNEFGSLTELMFQEYPNDQAIKNLYVDYLLASQKFTTALPLLESLAVAQPLRGLQAAAVARRLGQNERADSIAQRSLDTMSTMSDEDPTNVAISLAVAQNQLFLKRFTEAIETLDKAVQLAKSDEEKKLARTAFGDAIVAYVNHLNDTSENTSEDRLRMLGLLELALKYAPENPRVLTLISNQVLASTDQDNEELKAVRLALLKGVSPGVAHFIRGTSALMRDDYPLAERELSMANELMPLSAAVMNNLAVVLTAREDVDLQQPLKIIDQAIKTSRAAPAHFYETRGQVLKRMGRFQEAIPDLERALAIESLARKAHLDLAECYDKVGDTEMAELHREAAADMPGPAGDENRRDQNIETVIEESTKDAPAVPAGGEPEAVETLDAIGTEEISETAVGGDT